MTAPDGWITCSDFYGNTAFLFIESREDLLTAVEFRSHCEDIIGRFRPTDYLFYGLALLYDEQIWECIRPHLLLDQNYYIGMFQDSEASDYVEPRGGWYWQAYDGTEDGYAHPLDHSDGPGNDLPEGLFDNEDNMGQTPADCTRVRMLEAEWVFPDWRCETETDWDGICMIQY